jgi:hypothetical protein
MTAGYSVNGAAIKEINFKGQHSLYHRVMTAETLYFTFRTSFKFQIFRCK